MIFSFITVNFTVNFLIQFETNFKYDGVRSRNSLGNWYRSKRKYNCTRQLYIAGSNEFLVSKGNGVYHYIKENVF